MPYFRFVEPGRIAFVSSGKYKRKLCCIIDAIDQNRVLVDGPLTKVARSGLRTSRLHLTRFTIPITHKSTSKEVADAWKKYNITCLWTNSRWARKIAAKKKLAQLNDYQRYQLRRAEILKKKIFNKELEKLKRSYFRKLKYAKLKLTPEQIKAKENLIMKKALVHRKFISGKIKIKRDLKKKKETEVKK